MFYVFSDQATQMTELKLCSITSLWSIIQSVRKWHEIIESYMTSALCMRWDCLRYDYVEIHNGVGNDSTTLVGRWYWLVIIENFLWFPFLCSKGTAVKTCLKILYHLAITCLSNCILIHTLLWTVSLHATKLETFPSSPHAVRTIHLIALIGPHASLLPWSVMDTKSAPMAAMNLLQPVEIGHVQQGSSHVPQTILNAFPRYKSVTAIGIALTEAMSQMKFVEWPMWNAAGS